MPWHVATSAACPPSKPWAVINDETRAVVACHETRGAAVAHVQALYANVPEARRP